MSLPTDNRHTDPPTTVYRRDLRQRDSAYPTRMMAVTTYAATRYPAFAPGSASIGASFRLGPPAEPVAGGDEAGQQHGVRADREQQGPEHLPRQRRGARLEHDRLVRSGAGVVGGSRDRKSAL